MTECTDDYKLLLTASFEKLILLGPVSDAVIKSGHIFGTACQMGNLWALIHNIIIDLGLH